MIACGGNVELDNPGEDILKATIDGETHLLKPGERTLLSLEKGAHKIQIADIKNEIIKDTIFHVVKGGLLNIAGAEYLVWKDVFSPQSTLAMRKSALELQKLTIDKKVFDIDYQMLPKNQLYVEQYWDYGLTEKFPKKVYGWEVDDDKKYMIKTKLVSLGEFESVYMEAAMP